MYMYCINNNFYVAWNRYNIIILQRYLLCDSMTFDRHNSIYSHGPHYVVLGHSVFFYEIKKNISTEREKLKILLQPFVTNNICNGDAIEFFILNQMVIILIV